MRVAMIAPFGLRPKGTLGQRMLPLAQALVAQGVAVQIVAPSYLNPADAGHREFIGGVAVLHVALAALPGPLAFLETAATLARAALRWRPDVVHVFKPKGYSGLAALLIHQLSAVPVVQDSDDWEGWGGWNDLLPYSQAMKHFFAWQERSLPRRASAVTVASRTLQTQVWGFGVAAERVWYVPNGAGVPPSLPTREIARQQLGLGAAPTVLLYTRFWEYPLAVIIELLVGLQALAPDVRLLVLGAGERGEERELARLAQRYGVARALDLRGWAARPTIDAALAACDVTVFPFADTLMNRAKCSAKLVEALNAGLPVVASAVGQAGEYIEHGVSGLLVTPGDGGALAQGAAQLLADPRRAALGRAAQARLAAQFSWAAQAQRLRACYAQALDRPR